MTIGWADPYGYWLSAGRSVERLKQQLAGESYPRGAVLRRSQISSSRKPGRDDRRLAVHEMGAKNFPLQTTMEVIRHANVVGPVIIDRCSPSGLTLLHGHPDDREQMNF